MNGERRAAAALERLPLLLLLLLSMSATAQAQWSEAKGTFKGFWNVSGSVSILDFNGATVAAGSHEGTVVLNTTQGSIPAFETDCVGFTDERSGGVGRCVWTGPQGDLIYVETESTGPAGFGRITGTFVAGTGQYEGIQGGFSLEWNYSVSRGRDATFDGQTLEMSGRYQLGTRR